MALIFQTRGNSYDARYSSSGKTPARVYAIAADIPSLTVAGFTNELYSSSIKMDKGSIGYSYLEYVGRNNTPAKGFSANLRVAFPATTGLMGLWGLGTGTQGLFNRISFYYNAGTLNFRFIDDTANVRLNLSGAWTPTINTFYDLFIKWDGTTSANAAKIYVDSVLQTSGASSVARPTDSRPNIISLAIGSAAYDVQQTRIILNEFTLWDSDIDPTSVTLDSGSGSLNGASRSSPITASAFDGTSNSDPGAANVLSGTGYTIAGVSYTGSYSPTVSTNPGAANVLSGTGYTINGVSYTGSYHNLISTNPGASNVLSGTVYTINDTTYTGSLVYGTNTDPGVANVRLNTSYTIQGVNLTGTLSVPTAVSGTASTCDTNTIKETIRYVLDQANTTTASVDLSGSMSTRVNTIMKVNPEKLMPQASLFPAVTVFLSNKNIEQKSIAGNQVYGKRKADLTFSIVGMTWNDRTQNYKQDPADDDLEYLMENIELILRSYADLNRNCLWQFPTGVSYHSAGYDEQAHFRIGIIDLQVTVYY